MATRRGSKLPELVMEWHLVPRGSGNAKLAQDLASYIREHPRLKPHLRCVKVWTSRLDLHFNASLDCSIDLLKLIAECEQKKREKNDPTLPLFPMPAH
jgi:hypothetical protein